MRQSTGTTTTGVTGFSKIKAVSAPAQTNAAHTADMARAKSLGVTHYRYAFEIGWGTEALDHIVTQAKIYGLKVILCVFRNDRVMPTTVGGAASYATTVVSLLSRGVGTITHVEFWNEPNHTPFCTVPNASVFAQLVSISHAEVKAVYPAVQTITGGLSPESGSKQPDTFFAAALATNAAAWSGTAFKDSFDLVGWHPYCFPHSPLGVESWNAMHQAVLCKNATFTNFGKTLKFAATEFGAPSNYTFNIYDGAHVFNETVQAQWISYYWQAFKNLGLTWEIASGFMPKDGAIGGTWEPSTGLYRVDGTAKPAVSKFVAGL